MQSERDREAFAPYREKENIQFIYKHYRQSLMHFYQNQLPKKSNCHSQPKALFKTKQNANAMHGFLNLFGFYIHLS